MHEILNGYKKAKEKAWDEYYKAIDPDLITWYKYYKTLGENHA